MPRSIVHVLQDPDSLTIPTLLQAPPFAGSRTASATLIFNKTNASNFFCAIRRIVKKLTMSCNC